MDATQGFPVRAGHDVDFFVDGREMMAAVREALLQATSTIHLADWRLTSELKLAPDTHPGETLATLLASCTKRGVKVRAMIWKSPGAPFQDNRDQQVAKALSAIEGVEVVVVPRGLTTSHHQKLVLVDGKLGFVGGVDLAGGRWDDAAHPSFPAAGDPRLGDYQSVFVAKGTENPTAGTYDFSAGGTPLDSGNRRAPRLPWHDVHARVQGPSVADLEEVFRGRWNTFVKNRRGPQAIPEPSALPAAVGTRNINVKVVASIDSDSMPLTGGSVCRTYEQAYCDLIENARNRIYIENQYFVAVQHRGAADHRVIDALIARLKRAVADANDKLEVVVVLPVHPDGDPTTAQVRELYFWQEQTIARLKREVGDGVDGRIGFFSLANPTAEGPLAQIYVHAKTMVVDDEIAVVGSGNLNARSMAGSNDTEIGIVVSNTDRVKELRQRLCAEHLGRAPDETSLLQQFRDAAGAGRRLVSHPVEPKLVWGWESSQPLARDTFGLPDSLFYAIPELAEAREQGADPIGMAPLGIAPAEPRASPGAEPLGLVEARERPSAWDWFRSLFAAEAAHHVVVTIPPERSAAPRDDTAQPLRAGEGYFRVWLAEMFLAHDRKWFTEWAPVVHSTVGLQFGQERLELPYVAGALNLPGIGAEHLNRAVQLNHPLTPLLPFSGGTVEITAGLVALQGSDSLQPFLKMLGEFSGLLQVPQLSAVLTVARPLASGVQQFFQAAHAGLHLGYHDTFVGADGTGGRRLNPGFVAVLAADETKVSPERLWVKDGRLRAGASLVESEPLEGISYMLFRLETRMARDDWRDLKDIREPLDMMLETLLDDPARAETLVRGALTAVLRSKDLARADKGRLVREIRDEFEQRKKELGITS